MIGFGVAKIKEVDESGWRALVAAFDMHGEPVDALGPEDLLGHDHDEGELTIIYDAAASPRGTIALTLKRIGASDRVVLLRVAGESLEALASHEAVSVGAVAWLGEDLLAAGINSKGIVVYRVEGEASRRWRG